MNSIGAAIANAKNSEGFIRRLSHLRGTGYFAPAAPVQTCTPAPNIGLRHAKSDPVLSFMANPDFTKHKMPS